MTASRVTVLSAFPARLVALTALSAWNSRYVGSAKDTRVQVEGGARGERRRPDDATSGRERRFRREQRLVSSPCVIICRVR